MNKAIIGRKVGMTQVFTADGTVIPVTVVEAGPCPIVQVKTVERDGYSAVQLGFIETAEKNLNKPLAGQFKKAGVKPHKVLREVRVEDASAYEVGKAIDVSIFKEGEKVDVRGVSKGHGFTGVIKRWNFHRLKESHGTGPVVRHGGSYGANSSPGKVFKLKKMAGQHGNVNVTVQNLEVVKVDLKRNALLIKGAVPGAKGGVVTVSGSVKS